MKDKKQHLKAFNECIKSIDIVINKVVRSGGFTRGLSKKRGYMVSLEGYEKQVKADDLFTIKNVYIEYIKLCDKIGGYVGLWLDDGFIYFDISKHYKTRKQAIKAGLKNHQKSIYIIHSNDYIRLC